MPRNKKSIKSTKCDPENIMDLLKVYEEEEDFSKPNKIQRQLADVSEFIVQCESSIRKRKSEACTRMGTCEEPRLKLMDAMNRQLEARKVCADGFLQTLSKIITQYEKDQNVMTENKIILERLSDTLIKDMQQTQAALKQKLKTLKEIYSSFKKKCEETDNDERIQNDQFAAELEKLSQKLLSETKRKSWETMRQSVFEAFQNDVI